jgi:hypothetical protein
VEGFNVENWDFALVHDCFQADGLAIARWLYVRDHTMSWSELVYELTPRKMSPRFQGT